MLPCDSFLDSNNKMIRQQSFMLSTLCVGENFEETLHKTGGKCCSVVEKVKEKYSVTKQNVNRKLAIDRLPFEFVMNYK